MLEKKRYLLVAIDGPTVTEETARHLLYEAIFEALGDIGASKAGVQLKVLEKKKNDSPLAGDAVGKERQMAVVKCKLAALDSVLAALAIKRKWKTQDVALRVVKISGAIGKLTDVKRT